MPSSPKPVTPWSRRSPTSADFPILRGGITTVSARWTAAGAEHTGAVETLSTTKLVTAAATAVTPLPSRMLFTDACISPFVTRYW